MWGLGLGQQLSFPPQQSKPRGFGDVGVEKENTVEGRKDICWGGGACVHACTPGGSIRMEKKCFQGKAKENSSSYFTEYYGS